MSYDDPFQSTGASTTDGNTSNNFNAFGDDDPAAEFLEREKRELADITGDGDTDSYNDPFTTTSSGSNTNLTTRNNLITNGAHSPLTGIGGDISPIPSSGYGALSQLDEQMNEPEKIKKWKEEFAARIIKKDSDEEIKRKEMREQAKKELDDFYKQRIEQMERTKGQNRQNNRTLEDDLFHSGGNNTSATSNGKLNDWDKITSLCDFNPKNSRSQKDLTRYRSILLQLKQQQQQASGK